MSPAGLVVGLGDPLLAVRAWQVKLLVPVGVPEEAAKQIVSSLSLKSVADLKDLVGEHGTEAVEEITTLFEIATAYGFGDWLYFDASVVRGVYAWAWAWA